ncbi:type II secretion system protein [Dehalobacter sp. DCM]|uniref:type II secretion system protein n=1 Tax=Dehalobacter sp. DCM TaxID=2907827 RepID=UPI0030814268
MLLQKMNKQMKNKKGFTLIELIVVMAILAILAAIAIPRFNNMRLQAAFNADGATATQIVNAARIQETQTGFAVSKLTQTDTVANGDLQKTYMEVPTPQVGGSFTIGKDASGHYQVTFTAAGTYAAISAAAQVVTEGTKYVAP